MHALASAVTNASECARLYESNVSTKHVTGIVLEVIAGRTATGRACTSLKVKWALTGREKVSIVKIINIKSGIAPSPASTRSNGAGPSSAPVPRNRGTEKSVNSVANGTNSTLRHPIPDATAHDVA